MVPYYIKSVRYSNLSQIVIKSCLTSNIRKRSLENRANINTGLASPGLP